MTNNDVTPFLGVVLEVYTAANETTSAGLPNHDMDRLIYFSSSAESLDSFTQSKPAMTANRMLLVFHPTNISAPKQNPDVARISMVD